MAEEEGKDAELLGGGLRSKSRCAAWSGRSQRGAGLFWELPALTCVLCFARLPCSSG